MSRVVPPRPPIGVGIADDGSVRRMKLRLWQISITAITLFLTGWFCTMGLFPAILTVFITKHILVAIYAVGLEPVDTSEPH